MKSAAFCIIIVRKMGEVIIEDADDSLYPCMYYFTHVPPTAPGSPSRGATHGAETSYVFQNAGSNWTDLDSQVADELSSYWANFAANGDPNGKGLPVWPAIKKGGDRAMVLGDKIEVGPAPDKANWNSSKNIIRACRRDSVC
jgi:carboxylesterase type B